MMKGKILSCHLQEAINKLDSDNENDEIIDTWWFTAGLFVKLT